MIGKKLNYGDTIGLVSPAGPENPDTIKKGIDILENLGFKIKEAPHIYDKWGYLAGSDKNRADDIMNMFRDTEVDAILCVRGGYGTMRILPLIDWDIIKNNPKIFIGFSDITTLLNNIFTKSDLITFHGPMISSNWQDPHTLDCFLSTLMECFNPYILKNPDSIKVLSHSNHIVEGTLVGGNLSLITSLMGTPYEINTKDKIVFIEDVGEDPYKLDRLLTQILLGGKLIDCKGIILGQFTNCDLPNYDRSLTCNQVIEDRILTLNKPTISNFMSGHSYPKLTLPIGAKVRLDCRNGEIHILEPVVSH